MIGIRFEIPNEYDKILEKILNSIDYDKYFWRIVEDETYQDGNKNLFNEEWYTNKRFKELISNKNHYIIFLNLQLYSEKSNCEINNYDDFVNSSCIAVLLITDNIFVDVYSKNKELLKKVELNIKNNKFSNLEYIYDYSDKRKIFSAYE